METTDLLLGRPDTISNENAGGVLSTSVYHDEVGLAMSWKTRKWLSTRGWWEDAYKLKHMTFTLYCHYLRSCLKTTSSSVLCACKAVICRAWKPRLHQETANFCQRVTYQWTLRRGRALPLCGLFLRCCRSPGWAGRAEQSLMCRAARSHPAPTTTNTGVWLLCFNTSYWTNLQWLMCLATGGQQKQAVNTTVTCHLWSWYGANSCLFTHPADTQQHYLLTSFLVNFHSL